MAKRFNKGRVLGSKGGKKLKLTGRIKHDHARTVPDDIYERHLNNVASSDDDDDNVDDSEEVEEEVEETEIYSEPSVYDNLLKKLQASTKGHQNRKSKDEDVSDSEEEIDYESQSGEDDDLEDNDFNDAEHSMTVDATGLSDDEDYGVDPEDDDISDDEVRCGDDHGNNVASTSQRQSKFAIHIAHKLSKPDIENLLKRKWKHRWEMPALDLTNGKWMGTGECFLKDADDAATAPPYELKQKLYKHWSEIYNNKAGDNDFQSSKQRQFFSLCNSYRDILHHNKKAFYHKGSDEDSSVMDAYIMHLLNHVFRTRDLVVKHDSKLAKHHENGIDEVVTSDKYLDQGFTRPKVLILLPLASIALRVVKRLIQLTPSASKVNVEYMDRFLNEFGVDVDEEELQAKLQKTPKPSDHQALLGADNNDHFMVGIKFTRKCIQLYSDFYTSDIIVASPVGLITKIGDAEANKEKDVDYLSSIEILVIDHADVIAMQNWAHVNTVVEHLNHLPTKQHGTNIMRVRQWYLDEHAQFYRQTIILSSYLNPDINALFNRHCLNFEGKLRLSCEYKGVLPKVVLQVRQVYERFDSESFTEANDARLEYFIKKVYPKIKDSIQGGIMLFVSSYFEFVRLRNFLKSQSASFCLLGEYTKQSDISRARNWFIQGTRKIMLYTERVHFYNRYKIRGIQNLIIYSLPERKEFYPEVLNMLDGSHNMTCTVLFSRYDMLKLERIVGNAAAKRLTTSEKGVFVFC